MPDLSKTQNKFHSNDKQFIIAVEFILCSFLIMTVVRKKIKSVSFGLTPISGARGAVLNIPLIIIRDEKLLE